MTCMFRVMYQPVSLQISTRVIRLEVPAVRSFRWWLDVPGVGKDHFPPLRHHSLIGAIELIHVLEYR